MGYLASSHELVGKCLCQLNHGANLYPAMPYTAYAKTSDEDIAVARRLLEKGSLL